MSYYEDVLLNIFDNQIGTEIIESSEEYIQILLNNFPFKGDFIDWGMKEAITVRLTLPFDEEIPNDDEFQTKTIALNIRNLLSSKINQKEQIVYLNDNCFEECVIFKNFEVLENYVYDLTDNFPQRGYYMNLSGEWCLCVRASCIINFSYSNLWKK